MDSSLSYLSYCYFPPFHSVLLSFLIAPSIFVSSSLRILLCVQLYSSLSAVVTNFVEVSESVEGFNSLSDVKQALIAITMFAVLWGGGAILICILFRKQRLKIIGINPIQEAEERHNQREMSSGEAKKYLTAYVDEVFPAVFQTSSRFLRLLSEVMKHHRYLTVFSPHGEVSDGRRMLICLQLLTVQSMVMFMIAALYEIQVRPILILPKCFLTV
jgi:hypothetical protein